MPGAGLAQVLAAVHPDAFSGHDGRDLDQEQRGARDIFNVDHAAGERLLLAYEVRESGGGLCALAGGGARQSGRKHIDTNAVRRIVGRQRTAQRFDAPLGGGVGVGREMPGLGWYGGGMRPSFTPR